MVLLELGRDDLSVFEKVLVANRGEIAVRIIRLFGRWAWRASLSTPTWTGEALHTRLADEAYHVGPTPASESYLNLERLVDVAKRSGARRCIRDTAPGGERYLARAIAEAYLVWIGPSPRGHRGDGEQGRVKTHHGARGRPYHTRTEEPVSSADSIFEFAADHGYPVAVKASAGGGGKGFAVANDKREAESAYSRASREGEAYFGDGSVHLEKYLLPPEAHRDTGLEGQTR